MNLVYSPEGILQKEFEVKMISGYDPVEVDEFLDNVIKDYEVYNKELLSLQEENSYLMAKLDQLSKAQLTLRVVREVPKSATVTNFDILKRLSNLEREVFGKKLDETPSASATPSTPSTAIGPADHDVDNAQIRQFQQNNLSRVFTRNRKHLLE